MNVAIFGGFDRRPFAPGWTKEKLVAVFGGGDIDLASCPPGDNAELTVVTVFGGVELNVLPGTRISMSGFSLFGGRTVNVKPGGGSELRLKAFCIFGGVDVKEAIVVPAS